MSDYLYKNLNVKEGDMTKLRASYVCENALYEYSKDLELSKYIKVGHGEENDGGRYKKVILADIFESLMGAIYLDLCFEVAKRVILEIVVPYFENPNINFFSDYKSALQEYVQADQKSLEYELVKDEGPSHNKVFGEVVKVDGIILGEGEAGSKKEAEQEAARDALNKLATNNK
jgi:ribonuclease-3